MVPLPTPPGPDTMKMREEDTAADAVTASLAELLDQCCLLLLA